MVIQRSFLLSLFLASLSLSDAFVISQPGRASASRVSAITRLSAASFSEESEDQASNNAPTKSVAVVDCETTAAAEELSWSLQLDTKLMQEVRAELVQKYVDQGVSHTVAEQEVGVFLQDKDRSEKYLEMRAYAAAQADDLGMTGLQIFAGFLVGFIGIAGPKYYAAYKSVYPDGGGPISFL
jgi:hypothetical protein